MKLLLFQKDKRERIKNQNLLVTDMVDNKKDFLIIQ